MGYIGRGAPNQLATQQSGIHPTIQQIITLVLENLNVNQSAVLPAFQNLSVVPSGQSTLGTVLNPSAWQGSGISEPYGGTGQTSYSLGDILYANAVDSLTVLPSGAEGQQLQVVAGLPAWVVQSNVLPSVVGVTSDLYYASAADRFLMVSGVGLVTVALPPSPTIGEQHTIKDQQGIAASSGITVDGSGNLIDGQAQSIISGEYGALNIIWDGAQWSAY